MSLVDFPWQILIIVGAIFTSTGQAFNKHQSHRGSVFQLQLYKYISASAWITFWWWRMNLGFPSQWPIFLIYGAATGLVVGSFTRAVRFSLSKSALTTPVSQLAGVVLAAIFLKEASLFNLASRSGQQLLAAVMLIPVLFYFFYEKKSAEIRKWTVSIWVFIVFWAVARLFIKYYLDQVEPLQLQMLQYWGSLLAMIVGIRWKKYPVVIDLRFSLTGLIQGLLASTGVLLYFTALKQTTVAQTTLLRLPMFIILTTAIGFFGFKEIKLMTRRKWLGVLTALIMTGLVITNY